VDSGAGEEEVVEKIDIGGIALIRAAAKNFPHVVCVPSQAYYAQLSEVLEANNGQTSLADRMALAAAAFEVSSHYDTAIYRYLAKDPEGTLKISEHDPKALRYGENPHQQGWFYGDLSKKFEQLGGKELSFNNLVDIEAALQLVDEFEEPTFAVIKHTNPCGCATAPDLFQAWQKALEADPLSAFGGVLACNGNIDAAVAVEIDKIFFEVLAADAYTEEALAILGKKKNRILLLRKDKSHAEKTVRSLLGGYLVQDRDAAVAGDLQLKTSRPLSETEVQDAVFADTVCKHMKSNAIALVKNRQLIGGGVGQTSRIDSLKQAVAKAKEKGFDLEGAVLASDAFFPFADSVQTAFEAGIRVVIEPGGSVKDQDSVDFCETHDMSLIFTGLRHFKH
jgi:phosphoribosylaminoimidazolecarboxamide formyltransferase / IMP cyclohydrolase